MRDEIQSLRNQISKKNKQGKDVTGLSARKSKLEEELSGLVNIDAEKENINTSIELIKEFKLDSMIPFLTDDFDASNPENTDFLSYVNHLLIPSISIDDHKKNLIEMVNIATQMGKKYKSKMSPSDRLYQYEKQNMSGISNVDNFDEPKTFNSRELLRDCYGLARQQRQATCWLDAALELFLNGDVIGEIFRSETFEHGLYNDNPSPVPYMVKPEIAKGDLKSFIFYIIFNFILFNLEITNDVKLIRTPDIVRLQRQYSSDVCGFSFGLFMDAVKNIFDERYSERNVIDNIDKLASRIDMISIGEQGDISGGYSGNYEIFLNNLLDVVPEIKKYITLESFDRTKIRQINILESTFVRLILINTSQI